MSEQLKSEEQRPLIKGSDDEIHVLDVLTTLARKKKVLFIVPAITTMLAIAVAFLIKPVFTSTAVILPPQQQQSSGVSAMLGQLGGLAGAASGIAGLKNSNDLYVAMLQSRTIADKLIIGLDLRKYFDVETFDDARKKLNGIAKASSDKAGTISVEVEDKDPKFAAELANAFVNELSNLTQNLAITDAAQRRLFFEKQLISAKDALAEAEIGLRTTQEKTGMLQLDGQVKGIIGNVAQLEGIIAAKEVELSAMRSFATSNNPNFVRLQGEIQGYRAQLAKLRNGKSSGDGDMMVPTGKIPEVGVEYIRSLRNVKYQETVFELLSKQYELAKIDEAKESSNIQVLDRAVPAERKSKPRKFIIIIAGFFVGIFMAIFLVLLHDAYSRSSRSDVARYRWVALKNAWKNK